MKLSRTRKVLIALCVAAGVAGCAGFVAAAIFSSLTWMGAVFCSVLWLAGMSLPIYMLLLDWLFATGILRPSISNPCISRPLRILDSKGRLYAD